MGGNGEGLVICIMLLCFPNLFARVIGFPIGGASPPKKIWMQVSMTESDIYLQRNIPKNTGGNFLHSHSILSGWGVKEFETISHEDQLMEVR